MHAFRTAFFACFAVVPAFSALCQAQAAEPAARVGVINFKLAYSNLQETIDALTQVADMRKQLTTQSNSHQAELKEQQEKIDKSADRGTPEYEQTIAELDQKSLDFQLDEQKLKLSIARTQNRQIKQAFDELRAVVAEVAKAKGLDLVLVDSTEPNTYDGTADLQTLANHFFNRTAVYATEKVDITAEVIARLNQDYKSPTNNAPASLPVTSMQIGSKTYQLEIAADEPSRERGLMERNSMAAGHGMIFVFDAPTEQTFWMHHTRFPLDIIFADDQKKIVSIRTMKAYDESITHSDGASKYAIELNAGEAAATGVKPGDTLQIPAAVDAALKK